MARSLTEYNALFGDAFGVSSTLESLSSVKIPKITRVIGVTKRCVTMLRYLTPMESLLGLFLDLEAFKNKFSY